MRSRTDCGLRNPRLQLRHRFEALIFKQAGSRFQQGPDMSKATSLRHRYFTFMAAIVVACGFSFMTALVDFMVVARFLPEAGDSISDFILFAPVGFIGVLTGTFCLERSSRRYGSAVLLGLGLGFSTWFWLWTVWGSGEPGQIGIPFYFWPLLVGGLMAVIFFWINSSKGLGAQQKQVD